MFSFLLCLLFLSIFLFYRQFLRIDGHLGPGSFGSVEQGLWRDGGRTVQVALKLLKQGASRKDKVKLLQEAAIMAQFKHPNVVTLYGVVSKEEPVSNTQLYIVLDS